MTGRACCCLALLAAVSLFPVSGSAAAPEAYPPPWPSANVTFTVPFSRGSEVDTLFSLLQEAFARETGKSLDVRYVSGRAGADAWARIIDDAPDGSVVTAVVLPDVFLRSIQRDSGVAVNSMAVCCVIASMPCVLWIAEPNGIQSVAELAAAAAGMDGRFLVAGPGSYSAGQIASRALARETGVRVTYIPYTGTVAAAKAVLNREAAAFWGYSVPVIVPGFGSAKFRALAVASEKRLPSMPEVPTFRELGYNVVESVSLGIAVPAETPEMTREEIAEFFIGCSRSGDFRKKAAALGFAPCDIDFAAVPEFLKESRAEALRKAEDFALKDQ